LSRHSPLAPTPPPEATQSGADSANDELSFGRPKLLAGQDEVVPSSLPTLPSASDSSGKPRTPESDTEDDEASLRVPSSNTPSPLKLPPEQTDRAARALHESISNLLGKRNAGAMLIEEAEVPPRRKRARPRSKVRQQTPSFLMPSYFSLTITCLRCSNLFFFFFTAPSLFAGGYSRCERWRGRFRHPPPNGRYLHHVVRVRGRTRPWDVKLEHHVG
jgi:hypothetical protein